jgi:HEAT repeat protein
MTADDLSLRSLLTHLDDPTADIAHAGLEALSDIDAADLARFEESWRRLPEARRLELVRRLGVLADENIRYVFDRVNVLATHDSAAPVRHAAIRNLWESDDPTLVDPFLLCLNQDPSDDVRAAAAGALGHFVYLGELGELKHEVLEVIETTLIASVSRPDEIGRRSLESLGYSSRADVVPLIERAYADGRLPLRQSALLAMGRSCNERWSEKVLAHLHDPSPGLRMEAARAAGDLELREATPDIIELLEDVDRSTRHAAIWTLGQLGGKEALHALSRQIDRAESDDEADLLRDALDNIAFIDGMGDFLFMEDDDSDADTTDPDDI